MIVTLCTERIRTLDDIRAFLDGNVAADITPHGREAAYAFVERALVRFRYHVGLSRAGKGLVREFLAKVTGYSDSQLSRLIAQQRRTGRIRDHRLRPPARPFATVYTTADALLLAEVDEALGQLSGPATKRALWRMYGELHPSGSSPDCFTPDGTTSISRTGRPTATLPLQFRVGGHVLIGAARRDAWRSEESSRIGSLCPLNSL